MKALTLTLFCSSFLLFSACKDKTESLPPSPPAAVVQAEIAPTAVDPSVAATGSNAIGEKIYSVLEKTPGNLVFSPLSIGSALAMTAGGASGETLKQILAGFGLPATGATPQEFHASFGSLTKTFSGAEMSLANRLWVDNGFQLLPSFTALTRDHYAAEIARLDFKNAPDPSRKAINAWIEEKTGAKIKDLLKPGLITPASRLVLTNAIYFRGKWAREFAKKDTRDSEFVTLAGETLVVPTMNLKAKFRYAEDNTAQLLELPYKAGNLVALIFLPKNNASPRLSLSALEGLSKNLTNQEVFILLPKFTIRANTELAPTLMATGMTDAFGEKADFSRIAGTRDLSISNVVHEAFIDVNEEGTEAAGATAVVFQRTAMPMEEEPAVFKADHPFLFLVKDTQSGAILFATRVINPKAKP